MTGTWLTGTHATRQLNQLNGIQPTWLSLFRVKKKDKKTYLCISAGFVRVRGFTGTLKRTAAIVNVIRCSL